MKTNPKVFLLTILLVLGCSAPKQQDEASSSSDEALFEEQFDISLDGDFLIEPTFNESMVYPNSLEGQEDFMTDLRSNISRDMEDFNQDMIIRLQKSITYDSVKKEFRGNAKMSVDDFKRFKDFWIRSVTYFRMTSEQKIRIIKSYESKLAKEEIETQKALYAKLEGNFNDYIIEIVGWIDAAFANRRNINSQIFQEKYNRCVNSYLDFMNQQPQIASRPVERTIQYAAFFQEQPTPAQIKDELDIIIKRNQIEEYGKKFQKMDLDFAVGVFGFMNSIINFFKTKHQGKVNTLKAEFKLQAFVKWERV